MKLVYTVVLSGATALDEGYSDVFGPMKQANMGKNGYSQPWSSSYVVCCCNCNAYDDNYYY